MKTCYALVLFLVIGLYGKTQTIEQKLEQFFQNYNAGYFENALIHEDDLLTYAREVRDTNYLDFLFFIADANRNAKRINKANELADEALLSATDLLGEKDLRTRNWARTRADYYKLDGDYENAKKTYAPLYKMLSDDFPNEYAELILVSSNLAFSYYMQGKWEEATKYYEKCISHHEESKFQYAFQLGDDYQLLARSFSGMNDRDAAINNYGKALEVYNNTYGEGSPTYRTCLYELARENYWKGDSLNYIKCINLLTGYLETVSSPNDTLSPEFAWLLHYVGQSYNLLSMAEPSSEHAVLDGGSTKVGNDLEKRRKAKNFLERSNALLELLNARNTELYEYNLSSLVMILPSLDEFELADELSQNHVKLSRTIYGDDSPDYYHSLIKRCELLNDIGKPKKALSTLNEIRSSLNDVLTSELMGELLSTEIKIYRSLGETQRLTEAMLSYLDFLEKNFGGKETPYYLLEANSLAQEYFQSDQPDKALPYAQHVAKVFKSQFGRDSDQYVGQLAFISLYLIQEFINNGTFSLELDALFNEFQSIQKSFEMDKYLENELLVNMQTYLSMSNRTMETLAIQNETSFIENSENGLVATSEVQRRWKEAEALSYSGNNLEADKLINSIFEDYPKLDQGTLGRLVLLKSFTTFMKPNRDVQESNYMAKWAMEIYSDYSPEDNSLDFYLTAMNRLANSYFHLGDTNQYYSLWEEIHNLYKKYYDEKSVEYISHLHNYAHVIFYSNDLNRAQELFEKAIQLERKYGSVSDPLYNSSLRRLAKIYTQKGEQAKADNYFSIFMSWSLNNLKSEAHIVNEKDFVYNKFNTMTDCLDFLNYAIHRSKENPKLLEQAVEAWLYLNDLGLRKGRLYEKIASKLNRTEEYNSIQEQYSRLLQLPDRVIDSLGENLQQTEFNYRKIQTELGVSHGGLVFDHSIARIKKALNENQNFVMVIPFSYRDYNVLKGAEIETKDGLPSYCVINIEKTEQLIDFVILQNAFQLEEEVYINYMSKYLDIENINDAYKNDQLSYGFLFKPIEKFFQNKSKTYFSTSGVYNMINVESIYNPSTNRFVLEDYNICFTDPFEIELTQERIEDITLFGGVDFGDGKKLANELNKIYSSTGLVGINFFNSEGNLYVTNIAESGDAVNHDIQVMDVLHSVNGEIIDLNSNTEDYYLAKIRGPIGTTVELGFRRSSDGLVKVFQLERRQLYFAKPQELFVELPGSLSEIKSIAGLAEMNGVKASIYSGSEANEQTLKSLHEPDVLHIATHSFTSIPNDPNSVFCGIPDERKAGRRLLMNGMALAGVNDFNFYTMDDAKENGYVNSFEMSLLNLEETELAVLSSCESGIGASGIGEGIAGFKEGLKRAGVKNVILSSYKIDDNASKIFFETFYKYLFKDKMSIEGALRQTKLDMIKTLGHPYYWSSFKLY